MAIKGCDRCDGLDGCGAGVCGQEFRPTCDWNDQSDSPASDPGRCGELAVAYWVYPGDPDCEGLQGKLDVCEHHDRVISRENDERVQAATEFELGPARHPIVDGQYH